MERLIDLYEAVHVIGWPVAPDYYIKYGVIYPKDSWQADRYAALTERELFLSFARLGAHGEPSEGRILKWVRKYGLLRKANKEDNPHFLTKDAQTDVNMERITVKAYHANQDPMSVREFRKETREAYSYVTLLESIRSGNIPTLRSRMSTEELTHPGDPRLKTRCVALDGQPILLVGAPPVDVPLTDEWVLLHAVSCLGYIVESKLKDVQLGFMPDFKHPRPLSTYRPRLVAKCPDLYSALYYQFARLMADERPWMNCVICGNLMLRTHSKRKTCSGAYRKEKSRRNKSS